MHFKIDKRNFNLLKNANKSIHYILKNIWDLYYLISLSILIHVRISFWPQIPTIKICKKKSYFVFPLIAKKHVSIIFIIHSIW